MNFDNLRKIIDSDYETKDLNISDQDLNVAYEYILARDSSSNSSYRPVLKLEPYVRIAYIPTKKELDLIAQKKIEKFSGLIDSSVFIQNASFDSFYIENESREKALIYAKDFVENYPDIEKGMYIHGPYGAGKSYLLSAIAKELMLKNIPVSFIFIPDFVRGIKTDMNRGNLEAVLNKLKGIPVLMLDDLGGEHGSIWFRDEVLLPIIHYRISSGLPIFISSNLSYMELTKYLSNLQNVEDRNRGGRISRRIVELTSSFFLPARQSKD